MLRIWTSVFIGFIVSCWLCSAQPVPSQNSAGIPNQPPSSSAQSSSLSAPETAAEEDDEDSPDIPRIARGHISEGEYLRLRDQHLGRLRGVDDLARNPQARSQAIRKMEGQEQNFQRQRAASATPSGQAAINLLPPTWTALGPDPIPNGQVQISPGSPVPVSGRVTAIAVDPTNENIVYVGTAQGGLYRSMDGGSTWLALMDSALSLAIGAITIDPTDPTILFVGTGEGNFSIDSFFGVGLYVITGATSVSPVLNGPFHTPTVSPNPDGFTDVFTGRSITRILVNPANHSQILISTASGLSGASGDALPARPTRGVYASNNVFDNTGAVATPTFARLTIQTVTVNANVSDMVMDPGTPNTVLVSLIATTAANDGGIWVSNNAWAATPTWMWTLGKTGRTFTINGGPATPVTKFAVSRSTGGTPTTTFFAVFDEIPANCASSKTGTMSSSPDGVTWTNIPAAAGFCGGQCWYDMAVAANPTDPTKLYIGGNGASGSVGACGTGPMGISSNGGASFTTSETSLHADSHVTVVSLHNPSVVYAGNDGGIFRSNDGGATWNSLNNPGFTATQFESLAVHPTDPNYTIGGTQDNGTEFMQPDGTWTRADGGDGGFSAIDQNATDTTNVTMYHTYFNQTNNLVGYAPIITSATNPPIEANWGFVGCLNNVSNNGITCADTVLFYAPLTVGPGSPNTVYYGTDHLYRSADNGNTHAAVSQVFAPGIALSAIGIASLDDNVRLVGLENGQAFATTAGANPMTNVTGPWPANTYIARAVIDPNNKTTAYITLDGYGTANHVWKTTNLSGEPPNPTWVAASTGLPNVPVNAFAVDPTSPTLLYAGTDIGVFNSTDGGATWNPYGTGLPRVAVFDLKVTANHTVRIATHGRGMWEIPGVTPTLATTTSLAASPTSTTFSTPVTITATVTTNGNPVIPTGTMVFFDGSNALGNPVTLDATGTATLVTTTLSVAVHNITAHYSGDTVYSASTSAAQVITVNNAPNADYSLNIPNASATVHAGTSATYTINLTVTNGFTGSVNFTCTSGVPSLANCSF